MRKKLKISKMSSSRNLVNHCSNLFKTLTTFSSTRPTRSTLSSCSKSEEKVEENRRPIRQLPSPVRCGFIPDEWMSFFFPLTGVTGFGTFCFTFGTFLFSKEIFVCEHEYYNGISMALVNILAVKKVGPGLARYLDKEIDEIDKYWKQLRKSDIDDCKYNIEQEELLRESNEGQMLLVEAKAENVDVQLETEYRNRLMSVHNAVIQRLDYQVAVEQVKNRIAHKHMVQWLIQEVKKCYSKGEKLDEQYLECCIAKLAQSAKLESKE